MSSWGNDMRLHMVVANDLHHGLQKTTINIIKDNRALHKLTEGSILGLCWGPVGGEILSFGPRKP